MFHLRGNMLYCPSIWKKERFKTREVKVGSLFVGGSQPIRIQSMTTSNTRDVDATIEQCLKLKDAGCEIVRVTVQGMKEAEACELIKNGLLKKGIDLPLVADIHFFPQAAMKVCEFVDKVRINPGNFVDKRASFKTIEYNDASYALELEKIREKFAPLVEKCKKLKRAIRIGTNHGSLSDRIMNRYGDSPAGMVESAFEFATICREMDFHDIIFSMKASNPVVMIQAYRLLVSEMMKKGWDYPLHLGVTEAGLGEDGRVKSSIGIGSLLLDGLGDTVRVSLTEDPWHEIAVCKQLIEFTQKPCETIPFCEKERNFKALAKRTVSFPQGFGMHRDGTVFVSVSEGDLQRPDFFRMIGCEVVLGKPKMKATSVDSIVLMEEPKERTSFGVVNKALELGIGVLSPYEIPGAKKLLTIEKALHNYSGEAILVESLDPKLWEAIPTLNPPLIVFSPKKSPVHETRRFADWMKQQKITCPLILHFSATGSKEEVIVATAAEYGSILTDGLAEGIWMEAPLNLEERRILSFGILQGSRMRSVKTEFISCPSCGRTLFDLQEVTKRIQSKTSHLPGVKIAIMGCIVNGPGEMADADFGYVGSKPSKIDLYVGKNCVEKDIDFSEADERLIELIKRHGRWADPVN
jgi:(E)-4-hydroxy-3-methylbut-2-enyl-diphosphate synthase